MTRTQRAALLRGAASLAALVALLLIAGIAAVAAGGEVDAGRRLAGAIARKIGCAPRLPDDCRHPALVPAYGWPLARLARALAPAASAASPAEHTATRRAAVTAAAAPHLPVAPAEDSPTPAIRRHAGAARRGSNADAVRVRSARATAPPPRHADLLTSAGS